MEVSSRVTALTWRNSISTTSLHIPQIHGTKRLSLRVFCASDETQKGNQMIVSVTGATGFIGKRLVQRLHSDKHSVRVLTRSKSQAQLIFPVREFPGIVIAEEREWKDCIQGSNAVVNLAGMPISTRWSPEIKKEIKQSRVRVTSKVVDLINNSPDGVRPAVLVSATAVGYYGSSETQVFDESSPSGNDYLAEVCREWEATALKVNKDVRLVRIRIGVVFGKDGGALEPKGPPANIIKRGIILAATEQATRSKRLNVISKNKIKAFYTYGTFGLWKAMWSVRNFPIMFLYLSRFSWIHLDDIVNLIYEALTNPSYKGVINGTAPYPVRLAEMCEQLGNVMGRPSWLPVPEFALKAVLGEGASVVLDGQRVLPTRAKELGFKFKYLHVKDALKMIL